LTGIRIDAFALRITGCTLRAVATGDACNAYARAALFDAMRSWPILLAVACSSPPSSPTPDPQDWCARIAAGASSADPEAVGLAGAHAAYRYFGLAPREAVDGPLIAALSGTSTDLAAYAHAAVDTCALDASSTTLQVAKVKLRGNIAWVTPGTGTIDIPPSANAIALDLRGLPDTPELRAALTRATTALLASPLHRADVRRTLYLGHPDSFFLRQVQQPEASDAYLTSVEVTSRPPWPGSAAIDLPLAVITDVAMPPLAAELALELRTAARAMLVGHSAIAKVAEAHWHAVGGRGLAVRSELLVGIPDEIAADLRTDDAERDLSTIEPVASPDATATRAAPRKLHFYDWPATAALDRAHVAAALIVLYGTARAFWRVYDAWDPQIDAALTAELDHLATPTKRYEASIPLQRFAASLHDAHVYVDDLVPDATSNEFAGTIGLQLEVIGGAPVVKSSTVPGLVPGDTIVAVNGTPVDQWLAPYGARISSATPLNHATITAGFGLGRLVSPSETYTVRSAGGPTRTVTVTADGQYPPFGPQRASGWLGDVGAPDVYYMNINGLGGPQYTADDLLAQLDTARAGVGLVIDGRGYPSVDTSELIARIVGGPAPSPRFATPNWLGDGELLQADETYTQPGPTGAPYAKPVAVLVGPWTQSAAEDLVMLMMARPDLATVGRQTSGSNGEETSVVVPGGFGMGFTGMRVRYADGGTFHGIGIRLTRPSQPSVADLASGTDRELLDGIAVVRGSH
jgi:hypothetical protein